MLEAMLFVFIYGASPLVIEREMHRRVASFDECQYVILPAVRHELNKQGKNYFAYCR